MFLKKAFQVFFFIELLPLLDRATTKLVCTKFFFGCVDNQAGVVEEAGIGFFSNFGKLSFVCFFFIITPVDIAATGLLFVVSNFLYSLCISLERLSKVTGL